MAESAELAAAGAAEQQQQEPQPESGVEQSAAVEAAGEADASMVPRTTAAEEQAASEPQPDGLQDQQADGVNGSDDAEGSEEGVEAPVSDEVGQTDAATAADIDDNDNEGAVVAEAEAEAEAGDEAADEAAEVEDEEVEEDEEPEEEEIEESDENEHDQQDDSVYQAEQDAEMHLQQQQVERVQDTKAKLLALYREAVEEHERLVGPNASLHRTLVDYFKTKKLDEVNEEKIADFEQRYQKLLYQIDEKTAELHRIVSEYDRLALELKTRLDEKEDKAQVLRASFREYKRSVISSAENSRTGKGIASKLIIQLEEKEIRKEAEVERARLKNIMLRNQYKKLEQTLRQKEELADGLHLIDFEQLKIENQTYNEKIEERNEELLKLRKKITNTVQVLTHLKEKLQFVQAESTDLKQDLDRLEDEVSQHRDCLSRSKQERDRFRAENMRLRQASGLVGSTLLLRDFEQQKTDLEKLKETTESLEARHARLSEQIHRYQSMIPGMPGSNTPGQRIG